MQRRRAPLKPSGQQRTAWLHDINSPIAGQTSKIGKLWSRTIPSARTQDARLRTWGLPPSYMFHVSLFWALVVSGMAGPSESRAASQLPPLMPAIRKIALFQKR